MSAERRRRRPWLARGKEQISNLDLSPDWMIRAVKDTFVKGFMLQPWVTHHGFHGHLLTGQQADVRLGLIHLTEKCAKSCGSSRCSKASKVLHLPRMARVTSQLATSDCLPAGKTRQILLSQ